MSNHLASFGCLVDSMIGDYPILVDGEGEALRVGTDFTFPSITLENLVVVTDIEGDELYCEMKASLVGRLRRPPSY